MGLTVKITQEFHLVGGDVVELVARALYAHTHSPGTDLAMVKWPPASRQTLMAYWNKALAVVKAQRAFVENNITTIDTSGAPGLQAILKGESLGPSDTGAKLHSGSSGYSSGRMSGLPGGDSRAGSAAPEGPDQWQCEVCQSAWRTRMEAVVCCKQYSSAR